MTAMRYLPVVFSVLLLACSDDSSSTPDANDAGGDSVLDGGDASLDADDDPDAPPDLAVDITADVVHDRLEDSLTEIDLGPDAGVDASPDDAAADTGNADPCAPKPPIDDSGPYVRVGVGFGEYQAVDNCDETAWILGIQGGAHIWGAFQAGGFDTETDVFFHLDFEFEQDGEVIAVASYVDTIRFPGDPQGGPYLYDSVTVILDEQREPDDHLDVPGVLRLHLWRDGGVDLRDEVILTPTDVTF